MVLISVFPVAFVFSFIYSESLFLLVTLTAFYYARRGSWALAGAAGLMATLTRSSGLLLFCPW